MPQATMTTDPSTARWELPIESFPSVFRDLIRDLARSGEIVGSESGGGGGKAKLILRNGNKVTASNSPSDHDAVHSLERAIKHMGGDVTKRGKQHTKNVGKGLGRGAPPVPAAPGWPSKLREARLAQNVSLQFLANCMEEEKLPGAARSTLGHWESGTVPVERVPLRSRRFLDTFLTIDDPELDALEAAAQKLGDKPPTITVPPKPIEQRREAIAAALPIPTKEKSKPPVPRNAGVEPKDEINLDEIVFIPPEPPKPAERPDPEEVREESRLAAVRERRNERALARAFPEPRPVVSPEHRATEERLKTMAGTSQPTPPVRDFDHDHFNERLTALGREIYAAGREDGERASGEVNRLKMELAAVTAERDDLKRKFEAAAALFGVKA